MTNTLRDLKVQARAVRAACAGHGVPLTHSEALEAISRQHGHANWQAARAAALAAEDDAEYHPSPISSRKLLALFMGTLPDTVDGYGLADGLDSDGACPKP